MKRNPALKVPYSPNGNLLHHPGYRNGEPDDQGDPTYPSVGEWRDNTPFEATLKYQGTERGRSAAYFKWVDQDGRQWPMFITDIGRMIQLALKLQDGGKVSGRWFVVKRGQNYGITPAPAEDGTTDGPEDTPRP